MLWLLLKWPLIAVFCLYLARELRVLWNIYHYKRQGVKVLYFPIIGDTFYYMHDLFSKNSDPLAKIKSVFESNKGHRHLIVSNNVNTTGAVLYLLSDEILREFSAKEVEFTIKWKEMGRDLNMGFFFDNGDYAFEMRSIYARFFNYDNLKLLNQIISEIIQETIAELKKNEFKGSNEHGLYTKDLLRSILSKFVNRILLGEEEDPILDGKDTTSLCQHYLSEIFGLQFKPKNILTCGYLHESKILQESRDCDKLLAKLEDFIYSQYLRRENLPPKKSPNIIDLLIEKNKENRLIGKPELSKKEIAGHCILLQFASFDTSLNTVTSSVDMLASCPEVQNRFRETAIKVYERNKVPNYDDYYSNPRLECFINEFLRLWSPIAVLSPRMASKPFTLAGYSVTKGTVFIIPSNLNQTCSRFFTKPTEFDENRFEAENLKKLPRSAFTPFGQGRRSCVGKVLGEMLVRTLLVSLVHEFDILPHPKSSNWRVLGVAYGLENPQIILRKR